MPLKSLAAALLFYTLPAIASPAPVEVFQSPDLQSTASSAELPARLNTAWEKIEALLGVPEGPAPILYLFPFDKAVQPPRLTELQATAFATANPPQTVEQTELMYRQILGLTYDSALYQTGDADRGRVIQVSPLRIYANETPLSHGSGLYVTTHEMVHYALNRLNVDPKYHHCLMVAERSGNDPLLLSLLNFEISQGWASEFLKRPMRGLNGYALDQMHCEAEANHWAKQEGEAFTAEVKRLAANLPK
ncbi:MAG: hypothetical protein EOP11_07150 [Proteobacteria bacterium]|nr:MAG: hypothetical protein EOP11_07150 [Pseudomonadota bacterium]